MPHLEHVPCHREQILVNADSPLDHIFFRHSRCHMCPLLPRSRSVTDDIDVPETEAPGTGFAKAGGERSVVE
jgi:hypothetical protein